MSEKETSIHDIDFGLICEYYSVLERQGPGSPETTIRAAGFIPHLTSDSRIADIGCGTGGQTMVLARHLPGSITGVDLFPIFIDLFNANARNQGLQERVKGIVRSMEDLPFHDEELDLIWSEGAIYNIGFNRGLKEWRRFLKTGGFLAVSEASWFTATRPAEIEEFWKKEYPEMDTIPNKMAQLQEAGYLPVASFILSEDCWLENYYTPQVSAQRRFLEKHTGSETAEEFVRNVRRETEMYKKYKEYYGYVFYIGKKIAPSVSGHT